MTSSSSCLALIPSSFDLSLCLYSMQCWCWSNRDLLCAEYGPGEGEGRGHPGCISDSQESQTAAAPHGADTGEDSCDILSLVTQQRTLIFYCRRHVNS